MALADACPRVNAFRCVVVLFFVAEAIMLVFGVSLMQSASSAKNTCVSLDCDAQCASTKPECPFKAPQVDTKLVMGDVVFPRDVFSMCRMSDLVGKPGGPAGLDSIDNPTNIADLFMMVTVPRGTIVQFAVQCTTETLCTVPDLTTKLDMVNINDTDIRAVNDARRARYGFSADSCDADDMLAMMGNANIMNVSSVQVQSAPADIDKGRGPLLTCIGAPRPVGSLPTNMCLVDPLIARAFAGPRIDAVNGQVGNNARHRPIGSEVLGPFVRYPDRTNLDDCAGGDRDNPQHRVNYVQPICEGVIPIENRSSTDAGLLTLNDYSNKNCPPHGTPLQIGLFDFLETWRCPGALVDVSAQIVQGMLNEANQLCGQASTLTLNSVCEDERQGLQDCVDTFVSGQLTCLASCTETNDLFQQLCDSDELASALEGTTACLAAVFIMIAVVCDARSRHNKSKERKADNDTQEVGSVEM